MSQPSVMRTRAVLDTSFWIAAYRAEIAASCLDLFEIVVPVAVEREILAPQTSVPNREYPYATLFRHLRGHMLDAPADVEPIRRFGPGEADSFGVAAQLGALLLINERRAAEYASNLNVPIVTVPAVIVTLVVRDVINVRAAHRKFDLIQPITARQIIDQARRAIDLFESSV